MNRCRYLKSASWCSKNIQFPIVISDFGQSPASGADFAIRGPRSLNDKVSPKVVGFFNGLINCDNADGSEDDDKEDNTPKHPAYD